jgi:hypothetical protein
MTLDKGTAFIEKHWKVAIYIAIVVLVIYFWKDISNLFSNIFGGAESLTNSLSNPASTAELQAADTTIASEDAAVTAATSPFSPALYQSGGMNGDTTLSDDTASTLSSAVYGSWGNWISSAGKALAAFQQCQCQMDVSHVALEYVNQYSSNIYDDMSEYYDSSANKVILAQIVSYVNGLPLFYNG